MIVKCYTEKNKTEWENFINTSKNGTFLLYRNYMDYHADRFVDHSLMFYNEHKRLLAVMPANKKDDCLISHAGLTYGGIISDNSMTTPKMLSLFEALIGYCLQNGIQQLLYKTIPSIYHHLPAEEDRYALFRHAAILYRRDVLAVVDQQNRLPFQERRQRKIKQAQKENLIVSRSDDYSSFWQMLADNLRARFGINPVHSLEEIVLLARRFPEQIQLYTCQSPKEILAGVVTYVTPYAVHAQYISTSEVGRSVGALDFLFSELLDCVYKNYRYFDFGISSEQNGMHLNTGLIEQKEGFGARAITHDFYRLQIQ